MKKIIIILVCFSLIVLIFSITDTYGLFETNAEGKSTYEVGKWEILLNGEDVTLDREITLDDFEYTGDSHVEEGYLAPGGEATLDLIFDASNVQTALSYSISIDDSSIDEFNNLNMSVIDLNTNQELDELNVNGNVMLNDENKMIKFRMLLVWENVLEEDVNDINVLSKDISFPISMHFSQISEE